MTTTTTTCNETFGLSVVGVMVAALAGFSMGAGYGLLYEDQQQSTNNQVIVRRATGGALLVMGMYLWAPTFVREFWLASMMK